MLLPSICCGNATDCDLDVRREHRVLNGNFHTCFWLEGISFHAVQDSEAPDQQMLSVVAHGWPGNQTINMLWEKRLL